MSDSAPGPGATPRDRIPPRGTQTNRSTMQGETVNKPTKGQMDFLGWVALLAALGVSASGEYQLAHACGFGQFVAAGVPAALDVYAIRAVRAGRDVFTAVLAMIAANAAAHLSAVHLLPVSWPLIVAVSALAPLVLWRVHRLGHEPAEPRLAGPEVDTDSSTVNTPVSTTPAETPMPAAPAPQVTTPEHLVSIGADGVPEIALAKTGAEPISICGGTLIPVPDVPARPRLNTEQALNMIRVAWVQGLSIREAAARATRSPSYVQSVYARLNASKDSEPITGQTEIPVSAYDSTPPDWTVAGDYAA